MYRNKQLKMSSLLPPHSSFLTYMAITLQEYQDPRNKVSWVWKHYWREEHVGKCQKAKPVKPAMHQSSHSHHTPLTKEVSLILERYIEIFCQH